MCAALAKVIRSDFGTHCKALVSAVQRINNRKRTFHYLEPSIYQQHVCKRLLPREAECKNEGIHRKLFNRLLNYKFHYKKSGETWQHSPAFFSLLDQSIRVFLRNRNQYNIKWSISRNKHNGNVNLKNQKRMSRFFTFRNSNCEVWKEANLCMNGSFHTKILFLVLKVQRNDLLLPMLFLLSNC